MKRHWAGTLTGRVTKWIVLGAWVVIAVVMSRYGSHLSEVQNNETESWLPDTAESTQAFNLLPESLRSDDIPTIVLYEREGGLTEADFAAIAAQAQQIAGIDGVIGEVHAPPDAATGAQVGLVSPDGVVAQTVFDVSLGDQGYQAMTPVVEELRDIARLPDGGKVYITGAGGQTADQADAFAGIDGTLLYISVAVIIVILLITYRSPALWLLPLLSSGVALITAQGVVYLLAKHAGMVVNAQTQAILLILVLGAGTDYALLLVARYREELRRHEDRHAAMANALHRASPAIIASAATVALGMLCLLFASMNSTSGLGPVAAIGVGIALLSMLTFLPALLVVTGRWVFWPLKPAYRTPEPTSAGFWARVGDRIAPRPRTTWIVTAVALAACAVGLTTLVSRQMTTEETYTKDFDSVIGMQVMEDHGLADTSSPLEVIAQPGHDDELIAALATVPHLGPAASVVGPEAGIAVIDAALDVDPTSDEAEDAVRAARAAVHAVAGADAHVTGYAALSYDVLQASSHDSALIIPIILVVVMVVLMALLRAVLAPVLLMLTVVLSFGASMGLSALAFHALARLTGRPGFGVVDPAFFLYVFVFLVALGIDYNIFILERVREESRKHPTRKAALIGLSSTGGVITSAGLVLAATFAVLTTLPLTTFVEIGFAIALGVLIDTMLVRSVLVTALLVDFGDKVWWPRTHIQRELEEDPHWRRPAESV